MRVERSTITGAEALPERMRPEEEVGVEPAARASVSPLVRASAAMRTWASLLIWVRS